jgi:subtilase family serine protease
MGLWLKNLVDVLEKLNTTFNYEKVISQLVNNDKIFNIRLKEDELKYFASDSKEIESLAFYVKFTHPLTRKQTDYLFRSRRTEINEFYDFYKITSNKIEGFRG